MAKHPSSVNAGGVQWTGACIGGRVNIMLALGVKNKGYRISVYQSAVTKDRHLRMAKTMLKVLLFDCPSFGIPYHAASACPRNKRNVLEKCMHCSPPGLRKKGILLYNVRKHTRVIQRRKNDLNVHLLKYSFTVFQIYWFLFTEF